MVRKNNNNLRVFLNQGILKGKLLSRTRRKKNIIFGARSIQKQIGLQARPTTDFDIFSNMPRKAAINVERTSDKLTRGDNFYVKKGQNPGTWKVKWKGKDMIRGTKDDKTFVDFTKTPKRVPNFKKINGIRYRTLQEELQAKQKLIRNSEFKFRREKDLDDLRRIKRFLGRKI